MFWGWTNDLNLNCPHSMIMFDKVKEVKHNLWRFQEIVDELLKLNFVKKNHENIHQSISTGPSILQKWKRQFEVLNLQQLSSMWWIYCTFKTSCSSKLSLFYHRLL